MQVSDPVTYQVGTEKGLPYRFRFHFGRAGMDAGSADAITRYVEFWCEEHSRGNWWVSETRDHLSLEFATAHDVVFFHLSSIYSKFSRMSGSIVEKPVVPASRYEVLEVEFC